MFFDQFSDLSVFCNQLKGSLLILGDFGITLTDNMCQQWLRWMTFSRCVTFLKNWRKSGNRHTFKATFLIGSYIISDDLLQSVSVSHLFTSNHSSIVCCLHFKVPREPPVYKSTCNLKTIDNEALKKDFENLFPDLHQWLHSMSSWSLYWTSICWRLERSWECADLLPGSLQWPNSYWTWDAKGAQQKGSGKSGRTGNKQIFSRLRQQVTKLVQQAKRVHLSKKIHTSVTCKKLFQNVNIILRK